MWGWQPGYCRCSKALGTPGIGGRHTTASGRPLLGWGHTSRSPPQVPLPSYVTLGIFLTSPGLPFLSAKRDHGGGIPEGKGTCAPVRADAIPAPGRWELLGSRGLSSRRGRVTPTPTLQLGQPLSPPARPVGRTLQGGRRPRWERTGEARGTSA